MPEGAMGGSDDADYVVAYWLLCAGHILADFMNHGPRPMTH